MERQLFEKGFQTGITGVSELVKEAGKSDLVKKFADKLAKAKEHVMSNKIAYGAGTAGVLGGGTAGYLAGKPAEKKGFFR